MFVCITDYTAVSSRTRTLSTQIRAHCLLGFLHRRIRAQMHAKMRAVAEVIRGQFSLGSSQSHKEFALVFARRCGQEIRAFSPMEEPPIVTDVNVEYSNTCVYRTPAKQVTTVRFYLGHNSRYIRSHRLYMPVPLGQRWRE